MCRIPRSGIRGSAVCWESGDGAQPEAVGGTQRKQPAAQNCEHLGDAYRLSGRLRTVTILTLDPVHYFWVHHTGEGAETQENEGTGWDMMKLGFKPRQAGSRVRDPCLCCLLMPFPKQSREGAQEEERHPPPNCQGTLGPLLTCVLRLRALLRILDSSHQQTQ